MIFNAFFILQVLVKHIKFIYKKELSTKFKHLIFKKIEIEISYSNVLLLNIS